MQSTDYARFNALMVGMGEIYSKDISSVLLDGYWEALKTWELADFEKACVHILRTSKFMPRPADFTDLLHAGRMTAGEAWALVVDSVRKGSWRDNSGGARSLAPHFAEPEHDLIGAAVRAIGGYQAIAMHKESELHFLERRFCEHFNQIETTHRVREALPSSRPNWLQLQVDLAKKGLTQ